MLPAPSLKTSLMPAALAALHWHWQELAALMGIGGLAGFSAGLLGVGGGLVVVPGLLLLLKSHGYPAHVVPLLAAGTSLTLMVFTAAGSALSHLRHGTVCLPVLRQLLPWVVVSELVGILLATMTEAPILETLFGLVIVVLALDLLRRSVQAAPVVPPTVTPSMAPMALNIAVGSALGLKSGLFGLGGGALAIPYFDWLGLPPRHVVGTTALLTWPVALVGALAYGLLSPLPVDQHMVGVVGSVQWLGVMAMAPTTLLMAPLGARLCQAVSQDRLRQVFSLFLLVAGVRILL
ncbi:MAG: sulfite exporter TauE/SafE family protein [Synechococcus sp. SB0662_bin_45]|nr:sulfite exporter TauE/SafE family protein [Synechococcus sp. SB0668_bin_13]MXX09441.1 sulfite exporter TauE/SafE family protein [Synechococcus sp. SB0667_bin_8]MYE21178.1 sulfite exporter TauE/SafE family protein [Synechococcus sp. SB0662_bin_45]MYG64729.1 sulfite exporter TauE/SafE family protein [Synechococcus sp. SB0675_bin_7]